MNNIISDITNYLKENLIMKILLSLLFGIVSFYDSRLIFADDIFATPDKVFFLPVSARCFIAFILAFILSFAIVTLLQYLQSRFHIKYNRIADKPGRNEYIIWLVVFALLILFWLPYIMSYFPGGVYPDTATCIGQARSGEYNNQQPLLYTFIFEKCIDAVGDIDAVMLFSVLQTLFMAACFSYIIFRLYLHKVNRPVLIALFAYFALFNLIPLYVVSLWKDTLYSVTLLMYIFMLIEKVILRAKSEVLTNQELALIVFWMVVTVFLRNNGIYVMFLTLLIFAFAYADKIFGNMTILRKLLSDKKGKKITSKSIKKMANSLDDDDDKSSYDYRSNAPKRVFISSIAALVFCFGIQGPLFNSLNLNGPFVENLGVLQQQVAYVAYIGGEITPEQAEFLEKVCPIETMKAFYRPFDVDVIKWCEQYDNDFLEENKVEFIKVWAGMLKNNPKLFVDAYLYSTLGYWDPYKQMNISYVNTEMWDDLKDIDRYWQADIIANMGFSSMRELLSPKHFISSAAFLFLTLAFFILSANKKDKSFMAFIPALGTYLTVFIATPLAFALRYVYIVVLTLPLFIILAFIKLRAVNN